MKIEVNFTNEFAAETVTVRDHYDKACLLFGYLAFPWFLISSFSSLGAQIGHWLFLGMKAVGIF